MRGALLCLFVMAWATLGLAREVTSMRFDRLTTADGLSQSAVWAIAQDRTGFMWFATESGLDRYDGLSFKNYRRDRGDRRSLGGEFVRHLAVADDGSVWIATDGGGVSRWDPEKDRFENFRHGESGVLSSNHIRVLATDKRGFVWVGSRDAGLDRLNIETGQVTNYARRTDDGNGLSSADIHALAVDRDGIVWIGTRRGLDRLDPVSGEIKRHLKRPAGEKRLWVQRLLFDRAGKLWVGTRRSGLFRYDTRTEEHSQFVRSDDDSGPSSNRIEALLQDDKGRLWIGTDNGLSLYEAATSSFTHYRHDDTDASSLAGNYVISLFQDRGGMLWVGTRTGGVSKWNPRSWSFGLFNPNSAENARFSEANVTSFAEDRAANLWVGTFGGGINVLDANNAVVKQWRNDDEDGALSDDRVMAMLRDSKGFIWAGTMRGGLNRIDPDSGAVEVYRHAADEPTSIASNGIMALMEDSRQRLWVGTFGGGVSRLEDTEHANFTNFAADADQPDALASPRATSFVEDRNGVVWVGTDGGGLHWLDPSTGGWRRLQHDHDDPTSLSGDTVYALHVCAAGNLWVGTRSGLDRMVGSTDNPDGIAFESLSPTNEFVGYAVYGIQSDANGDLWLSTNNGLVRFSPDTGVTRSFHRNHGLQGEEFNFGASYAGQDGRLYFGGLNGFNAFDPAALEFNTEAPPVVLTSLAVANEAVPTDSPYHRIRQIDLDYDDDVVTFGIAALDYAAPNTNRYAYRLDGFDDNWVQAGNERRITYTNLDGGNYTLQVTAANSDGVWNDTGLSIPLSVAHPPWKTWWAYSAYLLAASLLAFSVWRQQQKKLAQEAEYRRRLEHEVHARTKLINDRNKDLREANDRLLQASTTDPLTGLRNRRFLYEQIAKDVDRVLRYYRDGNKAPGGNHDLLFLMVDLDNFKPVNDSCGHEAGDELLLQIRDVLMDACRFSDDIIRWGGDEFLVVAREANREFASNLAERIRASLAQRVFSVGKGKAARITTSIGYASYPFITERPELLSWQEVLGVADTAMYDAKQKRNAWMGIEGVRWDGEGDALYAAIKDDAAGLAEDGVITTLASLDATEQNYA